jgi:hypothetical protein
MLYQPAQHLILPPATQFRTTVQILLVYWALDMIVQSIEGAEFSGTEVAFVSLSVPSPLGGNVFERGITREADHRAGDDVVAVELADHVIDFLAVETRGGTLTGFEAVEIIIS